MTEPLRLAEEIDLWRNFKCGQKVTMQMTPQTWHLLAAALRLAEAKCALSDHEDKEYVKKFFDSNYAAWSDESDVLRLRVVDAEDAYRSAKESR